jgi:NADPH-dependent 2,4-dienoyl-CoA reductase/sulfur reductase-like enzyme
MSVESAGPFVVVGASLAGLRAVEEARALGFTGKIVLVGAEAHLPYDRPPLSKEYIDAPGDLPVPHFPSAHELRDALAVELRLGTPATGLDIASRTLVVGDEEIPYGALLISTGASPRSLPGTEHLGGVHTLRTIDDALLIKEGLDAGARTVVIGAGFIGSEVASAARKRGLEVTVVEALPTPLVRAVGEQAGAALGGLHTRNGTDLRLGVGVAGLEGVTHVSAVLMADGSRIPADLVIVGIGVAPATSWLMDSGLTIDNGVVCDSTLAAAPGVWAAGDVARWLSPDFDRLLRLEHWTNAGDMGAHAARNALSPASAEAYHHIPYFWSDWYGSRIQFAGLAIGEPTLVSGAWDGNEFVALYREGDRLAGVLTLNRRADIMKYRGQIARGALWDAALEFASSRNAAVVAR